MVTIFSKTQQTKMIKNMRKLNHSIHICKDSWERVFEIFESSVLRKTTKDNVKM